MIVHLWEEHGPDFASRLNGMFAIAVHDTRRRQVTLVRDRLGIKPLFWARTPHHLVFGSEIKAILASRLVPRSLNLDALGQFLAWEYVPSPGTLFNDIHKLEPGIQLLLDLSRGDQRVVRWWDLPGAQGTEDDPSDRLAPRTSAEWEEAVDQKIKECVRRRLVSDVPLGAFLSGGVDSSLVVAGMGGARAFTIGFEDPSYNETAWAREVAQHLEVSHRVELLRPQAGELFQNLMHFMDDPIADFSIFPTYLISRLARSEVTVALSGDGGDELFGGYETYAAQQMATAWLKIPSIARRHVATPLLQSLRPRPVKKGLINKAKRFVEGLDHDQELRHARWRLFMGEKLRSELLTPEALAAQQTPVTDHISRLRRRAGDRPEVDRDLYVDLKSYLVDNCLVKMDRMSMACSLEARVPLLDHELVELAFRMPPRLKVRRGRTKVLLKRVAARHVPSRCVYRPKQGFSIPIKEWIREDLRPLLEDLLDPTRLRSDGIFRADTIERLKNEHLDGRANHSHVLWALMVFQDWKRRWGVG